VDDALDTRRLRLLQLAMACALASVSGAGACAASHEHAADTVDAAVEDHGYCGHEEQRAVIDSAHSTGCADPSVWALAAAAEEVDVTVGSCGALVSTLPFVALGGWVDLDPAYSRASAYGCARIVSASDRSLVAVGVPWAMDSVLETLVPASGADVELEFIGFERCRGFVHARRRIRSSAFLGPRLLLHSDEELLAVSDEPSRDGSGALALLAYGTADSLVLWSASASAERLPAAFPRDLVDVPGYLTAWIEGGPHEPLARLRAHGSSRDETLDVAPDARLFRLAVDEVRLGEGLLLLENGRARTFTFSSTYELVEGLSFPLPRDLTEPHIQRDHLVARDATSVWRVWNVRTGREETEFAGLGGSDLVVAGRPLVVLAHDGAFEAATAQETAASFAVPDWSWDRPRATPELLARIGTPLAAIPTWPSVGWVVFGDAGVLGFTAPWDVPHTAPLFVDAVTAFGGRVQLVRPVWVFEALVVASDGLGGSNIFQTGSDAVGGGFSAGTTCSPWEP
jgi:hypothetical protein